LLKKVIKEFINLPAIKENNDVKNRIIFLLVFFDINISTNKKSHIGKKANGNDRVSRPKTVINVIIEMNIKYL